MLIPGFKRSFPVICSACVQLGSYLTGHNPSVMTSVIYFFYAGVAFNYAVVQGCTWAMLHAIFLFWGVVFPFSYRQLRISGRIRHAHIISIILAVVIPLPAGLIHLVDGYIFTANPAFACAGRNLDITFYTFILPISVIICITACLLVLILWTIFKVCV